jgi:soluble lytic murein transglycosylase
VRAGKRRSGLSTIVLFVGAVTALTGQQSSNPSTAPIRLATTQHPQVPTDIESMWLVPRQQQQLTPVLANFVRGVRLLEDDKNAAAALPLVSVSALATTPVGDYARYYAGQALLQLERYEAADGVFAALASRDIDGHLPEDAAFAQAEARESLKDSRGAVVIYESLVGRKLARPHVAWLRLGKAAEAAGHEQRAVEALRRVYFDFPLSTEADEAEVALRRLNAGIDASLFPQELARAEALYRARRWAPAKASYERIKPFATAENLERVSVHLAASDVQLKKYKAGRDALGPHLEGAFGEEATYYFILATRGLGMKAEYERLTRAFVAASPASPWAEEALNELATGFIIDDEDDRADAVFREALERYPSGRFSERAAWRSGWWAYRQGRYRDAARIFDRGAASFPRSDYRPPWLYWSGRAAEQLGDLATAAARFTVAAIDYYNSYYGRLALARLTPERVAAIKPTFQRVPAAPAKPLPTAQRISMLIATGLYREALSELHYAQRVWGDSPQLQASVAFVQQRLGNVRAGINAMKRAYPQYLAAGGEALPTEIQQVIFPLDYWPLLQKYGAARGLDPYLLAALVAQESNFDPAVVSPANAVGLMQVLPSNGRAYAKVLGLRSFSSRRLNDPETNIHIGTTLFANAVKRFGGVHFALAAYNAGDGRVVSWQRERPGMPQDEFIDDIPFPETQNYVKRILGSAEDYRRLYDPSSRDSGSR